MSRFYIDVARVCSGNVVLVVRVEDETKRTSNVLYSAVAKVGFLDAYTMPRKGWMLDGGKRRMRRHVARDVRRQLRMQLPPALQQARHMMPFTIRLSIGDRKEAEDTKQTRNDT